MDSDERARLKRRESRLHYDVERELRERTMFARRADFEENNVDATVATFQDFGSGPPSRLSACFILFREGSPQRASLSRYILS